MSLSVNILYFASIGESLGIEDEIIELPQEGLSLGELKEKLAIRGPAWEKVMRSTTLQSALNQAISCDTASLRDGDEIAFFPPVTGG